MRALYPGPLKRPSLPPGLICGLLALLCFLWGWGSLFARPQADKAEAAQAAEAVEAVPTDPAPPPWELRNPLVVLPDSFRPGDPLTVGYVPGAGTAELGAELVGAQGQRLSRARFFDLPLNSPAGEALPLKAAKLAVPSTAEAGAALVQVVERGGRVLAKLPVTITARDFAAEEIPLNPSNTSLRTEPDPKKTEESRHLTAILYHTGEEVHSEETPVPPVNSQRRTSFFGDRRVYRYSNGKSDTSIHAGIDYGVPAGTEVRACAGGRVVLARPRIVTGNSVVLEHLPGLYSLYYHLDKVLVEEGALVQAGDLIGQSGATGLATGPHLHWEIRIAGENTDPDALMARPLLDKEELLRKMGE